MPFFSIIVPTRNRVEDLNRCLAAIAAQSFPDFEVLVVDDGSDMETREKYEKISLELGSRFRFLCPAYPSQWGSGPGAARNRGIAAAQGNFIGFCDDDDTWIANDHLEIAAQTLRLTNADAYFADQAGYQNGLLAKETWLEELHGWSSSRKPEYADAVHILPIEVLLQCSHFPHLNISLYRKAVIDRIGGFWEAIRYEEDRDLFWRAMDGIGEILYRSTIVAAHNIPEPSRSANASTNLKSIEKMMTAIHLINHVKANSTDHRIWNRCSISEMNSYDRLAHLMEIEFGPEASLSFIRHKLAARLQIRSLLHVIVMQLRVWLGRIGPGSK